MSEPLSLPVSDHISRTIRKTAEAITRADALLITAGAGMSADSGLPVFRGNEGFWRAYPPLAAQRISFERMAQPMWFKERPSMAWAFYGHRLKMYRNTTPHAGSSMLHRWCGRAPAGSFVVTSNVDGQFQKAGFAATAIAEQHGSIHRLQCHQPCSPATWQAPDAHLDIDLATLEARGRLPACPHCGQIARPNILMFNDPDWIDTVTRQQMRAFDQWFTAVRDKRVVVLEIGAGTAIPTIRRISERAAQHPRTKLVRINPDARFEDESVTAVPLPALQALTLIDAAMPRQKRRPISKPKASAPDTVHYVDLRSGYSQILGTQDIGLAERQLCLAHWWNAQSQFAPLPALRGIALTGYMMRGQVVTPDQHKLGSHGGALLQIQDPRGVMVATVGFAWRQREGGWLWRRLLEGAQLPMRPLEYPREPWIARRLEPGAGRNAAMLEILAYTEYSIAVAWLGQE
jgi:NAD-dependent SIR2 family protein deacetylase